MKIPKVYRNQTLLSEDTGARPLTAQLNSAAMEAPGRALAGLGEQVSVAGQRWLKNELSIRRASNLSAAEKAYKSAMFEHEKVASSHDDPNAARAYLARQAKVERQKLKVLTHSFDGITKTRIETALSTEDASMVARARTEARKRMVSKYIATTLDDVDELKKEYPTASKTRQAQIYDKIFGRVGGLDHKRRQTIAPIEGKYEALVRHGHFNAEQQQKAEKNDRADLAEGDVRQDLLEASQIGSSDAAEDVYEKLQGGKYPDLNPDDLIKLSENALRLSDRLARRKVSDTTAAALRAERDLKKKQRTIEATLTSRIAKYQAADAQGKKKLTLPTIIQINDAFARNDLTREGHVRVLDALEKRHDPVIVDTDLQRTLIQEISTATTQADLDKIKQRALKALADKKFDITALADIENRISGRKNNTPEYRQTKSFEDVIESWTKTEGILDSILPGAAQRGQIVLDQFRSDVASGVKPLEALKLAVEAFRAQPTLMQLAQPRFGPKKSISEWNLDDVQVAIQETKTQYQGKARPLASQMMQLFIVKKYLEGRGKLGTGGPPPTDSSASPLHQPTDAEMNAQRKKNAK